jgi:hypothetical protein
MCHDIGIRDSTSSRGMDATSSHMPCGPFICILLAKLGTSFHARALIVLFVPHMGVINALEREFAHYESDPI